jgi:hypothetical protein
MPTHVDPSLALLAAAIVDIIATTVALFGIAYRIIKRIGQSDALVEDMRDDLNEIRAELRTNGGSSMKDQLTRVARDVDGLKCDMRDHIKLHLTERR